MQKKYFFLLTSLISTYLNAQITLTNTNNTVEIGDTYNYILVSNYTFDVSQSGANQTWDFSSATGNIDTTNCISPSNASEPSNFSSADLVLFSSNSGTEAYMSVSSSEISNEGYYIPGSVRAIYSDKQEHLKFPMTYNDVFNETFSGTVENISTEQTFNRTGTIEITADGYGNLILPYTTIDDVLRIKTVISSIDTYMGIPLPETTTISYTWFDTLNKNYLASTSEVYNNGSLVSSYAYYLSETDLVLDINKVNSKEYQLSIFPNPANSYTIIKNNSFNSLSASIYDTKGSLIKKLDVENGINRIDVTNFRPGVYIIKYQKDSELYTDRLVVK
ncbi:T9SS type A sorting domain-containing protein [Tamlana crocina]|uniref:T9SS type A sorting domain-containing protein n=1 Tax=Tamlana crocina TaxID=393006 RepID=A0ABX1DCV5_9FLAO|nr:T9SS type A sorting domain-containing protein [Tamlana crocina]NJX16100.1 T9SS type A sorting domain-containing protein [Tamlana crocina]